MSMYTTYIQEPVEAKRGYWITLDLKLQARKPPCKFWEPNPRSSARAVNGLKC